MWTAARSGSTARVSSSRGTSIKSWLSCPAALAPTLQRWLTQWSVSMTRPTGASSAGAMPVAQRNAWTFTSHRHAIASVQPFPATLPPWRHSTAATVSAGSWSREGKVQACRTWSALSSPLSSTSKWTCCRGSCAKVTGAASMQCGRPTTDSTAQKTPTRMCSWMNWRRLGSIEGPQPKASLCFRKMPESNI